MKITLSILVLLFAGLAYSADLTIRQRPYSNPPAWDWRDDSGRSGTIRERYSSGSTRYFSDGSRMRARTPTLTPTYDWQNSLGESGTLRQRPYAPTPTWDWRSNSGDRGTVKQRPYGFSPTWDFRR